MALIIKDKIYRNLEEQVQKNKEDIEEIKQGGGIDLEPRVEALEEATDTLEITAANHAERISDAEDAIEELNDKAIKRQVGEGTRVAGFSNEGVMFNYELTNPNSPTPDVKVVTTAGGKIPDSLLNHSTSALYLEVLNAQSRIDTANANIVATDAKAVQAQQTANSATTKAENALTQANGKVAKKTTAGTFAYAHTGNVEQEYKMSLTPAANAIPVANADGNINLWIPSKLIQIASIPTNTSSQVPVLTGNTYSGVIVSTSPSASAGQMIPMASGGKLNANFIPLKRNTTDGTATNVPVGVNLVTGKIDPSLIPAVAKQPEYDRDLYSERSCPLSALSFGNASPYQSFNETGAGIIAYANACSKVSGCKLTMENIKDITDYATSVQFFNDITPGLNPEFFTYANGVAYDNPPISGFLISPSYKVYFGAEVVNNEWMNPTDPDFDYTLKQAIKDDHACIIFKMGSSYTDYRISYSLDDSDNFILYGNTGTKESPYDPSEPDIMNTTLRQYVTGACIIRRWNSASL